MEKKPTDVLEEEHRSIQKVVGALAVQAEAMEGGREPDLDLLEQIVDFLRVFADRCHHGKEEDILFPLLESKGVPPHGCPLGALKHDHVAGRALVSQLAQAVADRKAGAPVPNETFVKCLRGLTELYPNHIWKEDYLLFPMVSKVLGAEDQAALLRRFAEADREIGSDAHHRYEDFAEKVMA
jgi:hemerythrin-like domain-containing protein